MNYSLLLPNLYFRVFFNVINNLNPNFLFLIYLFHYYIQLIFLLFHFIIPCNRRYSHLFPSPIKNF